MRSSTPYRLPGAPVPEPRDIEAGDGEAVEAVFDELAPVVAQALHDDAPLERFEDAHWSRVTAAAVLGLLMVGAYVIGNDVVPFAAMAFGLALALHPHLKPASTAEPPR